MNSKRALPFGLYKQELVGHEDSWGNISATTMQFATSYSRVRTDETTVLRTDNIR